MSETKTTLTNVMIATGLNQDDQTGAERITARAVSALAQDVHFMAHSKGWWPVGGRNDGECIALMHSELSEALEALRSGAEHSEKFIDVHPTDGTKDRYMTALEEEMADVILRVLDFSAARGLDIGAAVMAKMAYNANRPSRHGKNF